MTMEYGFLKTAGRIINSGQSHSLIVSGNTQDLYYLPQDLGDRYVTIIEFLAQSWSRSGRIILIYELNGPIRFIDDGHKEKVKQAWVKWRTGMDADQLAIKDMVTGGKARASAEIIGKTFEDNLTTAVGQPTVALEFLRQLCLCSRSVVSGNPCLPENFIVLLESVDMMIPEGEIPRLSDADRHRISICQDWFSDPGFSRGGDAVVLLSESRSLINHRVSRLPQVIEVKVPFPDTEARQHYIQWFEEHEPGASNAVKRDDIALLARSTAGLPLHALNQLLKGALYERRHLAVDDVVPKVEEFIQQQLGEDVVEFKKPHQKLDDLVGFHGLKQFIREELIPRFDATGPEALTGAAVAGPIGVGKTFIFEAVASELDVVVLSLKSIRSQWYGQTDVIFERLRRVLEALDKVLVFIDEADTQFGGVGPDAHETERRLTGKIQQMMSDTRLRGKVIWLLMTARIHLLSPDIRRPGRVGDLIIPVLDPEGEDRDAFIRWAVESSLGEPISPETLADLRIRLSSFFAASFSSLRSELKATKILRGRPLMLADVHQVVQDLLVPPIAETRRYQTLQALTNCTRRRLLPDPNVTDATRASWQTELQVLEARGQR